MLRRKSRTGVEKHVVVRQQTPANALLEKALINLCVIGQLREGDRLAFTSDGFFLLQRPAGRIGLIWTTVSRVVSRTSRWQTLERVNDLVNSTTFFREREDRERIDDAVRGALPGLRALQRTYSDDALVVQNLEVLTDRIQRGFATRKE